MPDQALSDIKVLDFTHYIAGPYCAKLLADYGADILKIERPDVGDGARRLGPFPGDVPHPEKSGLFLHLNTNKRGVTLNLKTEAARNIVRELVKDVDVVVESFRPGTMARHGLDYDSLRAINPNLVITSISNFGQTGPYRDYRASEIIFYGMGGEMYSTGLEDREPIKLGGTVGLFQAGATAAVATIGALFAVGDKGTGQQVDVSILETQVGSIDRRMSMLIAYQYSGEISHRPPLGGSPGYPIGVYPCEDGYIQVWGGQEYFPRTVRMLGEPDVLKDPRWYTPEAQRDPYLQAEFEEYFLAWTLDHSKADVWRLAQQSRVLSGPLNTMEEVANDPHFTEHDAFADIEHPVAGRLKYPGRPFIMNESPWQVRRPAPLLGQHNQEVLSQLGYSQDDIVQLRQQNVI